MKALRAWVAPGAVMLAVILALWAFSGREEPAPGVAVPLPPTKAVAGQNKAPVPMKSVDAYPHKVKAKAKLPAAIVDDDTKHMVASGKLDAEARPYSLYALVDSDTGESTLMAKAEPLPWIGRGKRGAVGIAYGLNNGELGGKLYAYQDLLKVKALAAGVRAEIDNTGNHFAGGYVEYQF